ncbi:LutC/YkgG family protein [Duganella violaceipulchra]|uniref:L-lactate dehydrogenase complex protein LldG n=1 Tax=Duganella violaceipulchra TaxID=2849652 RepID=A0AA41HER2_9BURK|nr:LUD domain-containing protein [Duganella violaceicalia]MBV6325336.1 LUD domain-containing protein [Duganella violaceicalia]MCP2009785.1 L-lactate dehydrogenase complex protein LldG [Duganella violaceicalia]
MSARELILGKLLAAAAAPGMPIRELDDRIDTHHARGPLCGASSTELADTLERVMTLVRTDVWRVDINNWPALLAQKLAAAGVRSLLLDSACAEGGKLAAALPAEVRAVRFDRPLEEWKDQLFADMDAGFTVARSGIAATGTLVLAPDAGTPRTVSLVPPLHVALVYASTLHADLHAAMHAEAWSATMPTNLVLVSGPSKTSDIQQTLAYGAHGPRALWVFIIDDDAVEATA